MKITWIIEKEDIINLQKFVQNNETALVKEIHDEILKESILI